MPDTSAPLLPRWQKPADPADEVRRALFLAGAEEPYADGALYDHTWRRRREDVRFYADLAGSLGGPVLEMGVGTGRVAFEMARRGVDVVGVDRLPAMLGRARERLARLPRKVAARVELREGDVRSLRLRRRFPLIVAPFNAFMHLYERQDWEAALATIRRHLAPGGLFAFDVRNPDPAELARDPARLYRGRTVRLPDGRRYAYAESFAYDSVRQVEIIDEFYTCAEDPAASFRMTLAHRQVWPAELETLLYHGGFTIEARHGDFVGGPFDDLSEIQLVLARVRIRGAPPGRR